MLKRLAVVSDSIFGFTHVVEGVSHADQCLNLVWTVLECLLVILDRILEVASFEEQVAHRDKTKNVLRVD